MKEHRELSILLVECGPWLVGVEGEHVVRIELSQGARGAAMSLADILGVRGALGREARRLTVIARGERREVEVDRVVGMRAVDVRSMQALPKTLRHVGAPGFWLGTMWTDNRLV